MIQLGTHKLWTHFRNHAVPDIPLDYIGDIAVSQHGGVSGTVDRCAVNRPMEKRLYTEREREGDFVLAGRCS
jgi:hypothetical protein